MKAFTLSCAALLGFALCGCDPDTGDPPPAGTEAPTPAEAPQGLYERARASASAVGDTLERSWNSVSDYAAEQKEPFLASLEEGAEEVDEMIAAARDELDELSGSAREVRREGVEELQEARDELEVALEKARGAGSDGWDATKREVGEAWDELQRAVAGLNSEPAPEEP